MRLNARLEPHAFRPADLVGGHVALDFVNTVTGRNAVPRDWLFSYAALLEWATHTGAFEADALAALERRARRHSSEASDALAHAREVRESLHAIWNAVAQGRALPRAALGALDAARAASAGAGRLVPAAGGGARLAWSVERSGLGFIVDVVTARAADLLAHGPHDRLRVCAGDDCGWHFLDRSKGGQRRWCDMATCGNVAKARRHLGRLRGSDA